MNRSISILPRIVPTNRRMSETVMDVTEQMNFMSNAVNANTESVDKLSAVVTSRVNPVTNRAAIDLLAIESEEFALMMGL